MIVEHGVMERVGGRVTQSDDTMKSAKADDRISNDFISYVRGF